MHQKKGNIKGFQRNSNNLGNNLILWNLSIKRLIILTGNSHHKTKKEKQLLDKMAKNKEMHQSKPVIECNSTKS